jgi:hypothetical protein
MHYTHNEIPYHPKVEVPKGVLYNGINSYVLYLKDILPGFCIIRTKCHDFSQGVITQSYVILSQ